MTEVFVSLLRFFQPAASTSARSPRPRRFCGCCSSATASIFPCGERGRGVLLLWDFSTKEMVFIRLSAAQLPLGSWSRMFAVAPLHTGGKGAPLHAGILVLVLHKAAAVRTTRKALSRLAGWESWAPGARGRTQPRRSARWGGGTRAPSPSCDRRAIDTAAGWNEGLETF